MSNIAKCARASQIARNVRGGIYVKQRKFAGFGSIPEDSIYYHTLLAEQVQPSKNPQLKVVKVKA
jgi:hypothetical protein